MREENLLQGYIIGWKKMPLVKNFIPQNALSSYFGTGLVFQ